MGVFHVCRTNKEGEVSNMRKKSWVPVWAIIIASIFIATQYGKVPPSQPSMIECLGISYTMQSLLMTAFSAAAVVMALVGGTLIDRFGARKVVSAALAVSIVGNILGILVTSDAGLLVSRVLEGTGYGVTMTAGPVIISAWHEPAKRGLASGVWGANVGVGMLICTGAANPILAATDWTGMWIFSLVATSLALALTAICVTMPERGDRKDLDELALAESGNEHSALWGYKAPLAIITALMFFLVGGATDAFNSFTVTYLNVELGNDYGMANAAAMIASVGMLVGAVIVGMIFAKVEDKGLVLIINIALAAIVLFAWFNLDASAPATYAVAFVTGCVLGAAPTVFFAIPPYAARSASSVGAAAALIVLGQNMGTLTIPTVVGMVLDSSGYHTAAMVMGGLACVALVISIFVRPKINARQEELED